MITISHLTKIFEGKGPRVTALEDVNLEIGKGDIYGIIGMSGAGKSTLLRCLTLLERPTSGSVVVDGKDMTKLSVKELRKARGLRQEDVAALLGVSRQTVNAVENDRYGPTLSLGMKLARLLETPVEELFTLDG